MPRFIPLLLIVILTLAGGAVAGVLADRWGPPADALAAAASLDAMPAEFGDWRLDAETPMGDDEIEMLRCSGHVSRRYLNRSTGQMVQVAVLVGSPGRISVHTPEVCYAAAGNEQIARREHVTVRLGDDGHSDDGLSVDDTAVFWRVPFVSETRDGAKVAVYYGWSAGSAWSAPERPRLAFGGRPFLYKIQIDAPLIAHRGGGDRDAGRDFLESFIPALAQAGIPSAGSER